MFSSWTERLPGEKQNVLQRVESRCSVQRQSPGTAQTGRWQPLPRTVPSRKSVMLYVAEMIPKLKTRTQKSGGADPSLQQGEGSKKGKGKKKK